VDKANPLFEGFVVVDEGIQRNADGALFLERLDEEREFEPLGPLDTRAGRKDGKVGHANLVIG